MSTTAAVAFHESATARVFAGWSALDVAARAHLAGWFTLALLTAHAVVSGFAGVSIGFAGWTVRIAAVVVAWLFVARPHAIAAAIRDRTRLMHRVMGLF